MRLSLLILLFAGSCSDCGRPLPLANPAIVDLAVVYDLALRDHAVPDSAIPDGAVPDGAVPDGAVPDSALPGDLAFAPQWQPAVELVPATVEANYAPAVALNEGGEALVAWRFNKQPNPGHVSASRFLLASSSWSPVEDVPLTPSTFNEVFVGLDDTGQAAAYQCVDHGELAHYDPTTATWIVQTLAPPDSNAACARPVSMPTSTRIIGVWQLAQMSPAQLWAGRYDLFGWSQTLELDSSSVAVFAGPSVHAHANGNAAVLYLGYYPKPQLQVRRFDPASQSWTSSLRIDKGPALANSGSIAVDGAGNAMAVWDDGSVGKNGTIWARRYDAATQSWEKSESVGTGTGPRVALSDNGTAIAMWGTAPAGSQPGPGDRIHWSRFAAGAWDAAGPLLVGPPEAGDPHVAMNRSGQAAAAWVVRTAGMSTVWASRLE